MVQLDRNRRFQTWLLERMVELDYTPGSLAVALGVLDGFVEGWVAGRDLPSADDCRRLAQLFEVPFETVLSLTTS